jgi:two-component system, NarL family, response regulator NreC
MLNVLIVDDHVLFREGLRLLLSKRPGTSIAGEAASGPEAVRLAAELKPDLVILDVAMPEGNGVDAVPLILKAHPETRIIALSTFEDEKLVSELLAAGIHGYVLKSSAFAELDAAIGQVLAGHRFLSPSIADGFFSNYLASRQPGRTGGDGLLDVLSDRERTVLRLFCEDKDPKQIAAELGISRKTVDIHKRNTMRKLGVDSDLGLLKLALKERILPEN